MSQRDDLIKVWMNHFHNLSKSLVKEDTLNDLSERIRSLATASLQNEEYILDVPFTLDELRGAVARLKSRKSCGSDGLSAEHVKWGGETLIQSTNKNGKCRKRGFKAGKETFTPISWQQDLLWRQNNHKSAKKKAANAVNSVSNPTKKRFRPYLGNCTSN